MHAPTDVDDVVVASRALLALVARTLGPALEQVTLPQFRVLVVLVAAGPQRVGALAERLDALPSTFTRTLDRLEQAGWVSRSPSAESRREVIVSATDRAAALVRSITDARRRDVAAVLDRVPAERRTDLARAFRDFADAAGEPTLEDLLPIGG